MNETRLIPLLALGLLVSSAAFAQDTNRGAVKEDSSAEEAEPEAEAEAEAQEGSPAEPAAVAAPDAPAAALQGPRLTQDPITVSRASAASRLNFLSA